MSGKPSGRPVDRETFRAYLEKTREKVDAMPAWEQSLLGWRPANPTQGQQDSQSQTSQDSAGQTNEMTD